MDTNTQISNRSGGTGHAGPNGQLTQDATDSREVANKSYADAPGDGELQRSALPPVDIYEDEAGMTLLADMPGVPKENIGIKVTGDTLVIEGTASIPLSGDVELLYGEVQNSQYRRSFTLSRELDPAHIEAKLANGVLRLRIPKAEEARPRRIEVRAG